MNPLLLIPVSWWLCIVLACTTAWERYEIVTIQRDVATQKAQHAEALAKQVEDTREKERIANEKNNAISKKLALAENARRSDAAASAARLRALAQLPRPTAAAEASCRNLDAPAISKLPAADGENLEQLAADADGIADRLRACQAYITDVVKPGQ